jgi:DNA-binding transcriptional LysR family regulator
MPKVSLPTSPEPTTGPGPTGGEIPARRHSVGLASNGSGVGGHGDNWGSIDLNLLIVFDVLMREHSLTRAGRRLGLSQPATSHALARLRRMLDDDLFVRTPEGMQPTARAEQMAEPVRSALHALSITLEPEAFDPASAVRDFNVAVNNHAARAIVPTLIRDVADVAPHVTLDIRPIGIANLTDVLDAGTADVAIGTLIEGGDRFRCVRIMDDDYAVLLDRDHPAATEPLLSAELFAAIPHVAITSTGDDTHFIDEALEQRGLVRRIATRVPFLSLVLVLVNSNLLAVVPRRVAIDLTRICPLVVKELPFRSPRIALSMIWHRRVENHAAHRWLRDRIRYSVRP